LNGEEICLFYDFQNLKFGIWMVIERGYDKYPR